MSVLELNKSSMSCVINTFIVLYQITDLVIEDALVITNENKVKLTNPPYSSIPNNSCICEKLKQP